MDFNNLTLIDGVFVKELKNRFLCEVIIDGKSMECYVPSSCHLSNFIDISNCPVLLIKNPEKSRTAYFLFAFKLQEKYVLLNTSIANKIIFEKLSSRMFAFLGKRKNVFKEYKYQGYKSDIFIEDTNSFIEIKSLLTLDKIGIFPTVYSERTINQLKSFCEFLRNGIKVNFFIVSLNPYVKKIQINKNTDFYLLFKDCISLGMKLYGFKIDFNNSLSIKRIPCII